MPGIGEAGQERLAKARVIVLGAGGLGFPVLTYLGAAGVGSITIVDRDVVEASNLNRQCLFTEADLGRPKAPLAAGRLAELNSRVRWLPVQAEMDEALAADLLAGSDLALDCSDNWEARSALSAAAWRAGVPLLHGAVAGFEGTLGWFAPRARPCFRCVYPEPERVEGPPPVLGAVAGVVGSLMAAEAIRALCGLSTQQGSLLLLDLERASFDRVAVPVNPACALCGSR